MTGRRRDRYHAVLVDDGISKGSRRLSIARVLGAAKRASTNDSIEEAAAAARAAEAAETGPQPGSKVGQRLAGAMRQVKRRFSNMPVAPRSPPPPNRPPSPTASLRRANRSPSPTASLRRALGAVPRSRSPSPKSSPERVKARRNSHRRDESITDIGS